MARGSRTLPLGGGGGEVEERCTSQGGAKPAARERPNALLGGHPGVTLPRTQRPTPNAQRPNTQRSAVASPTVHLPRPPIWHRKVLERGSKTCDRTPRKVTSSSTFAAGATLPPNTQRPTPNAQTPNAQNLVCAQHPTPNTQRPTPNAQRLTPNAKVQTPSDQDDAALLEL